MPFYLIAYHGGERPSTPEEGMALMEDWKSWISGLGDSVLNPGTPLPQSKIVTRDGITDDTDHNNMNGFAIIRAESMDSILEIVKRDPFLKMNGKIRVSEMKEMTSD